MLSIAEELGLEHPAVAEPLVGLATVQLELGLYGVAQENYERAIRVLEPTDPLEARALAFSLGGLAQCLIEQGHLEAAEPHYVRAIAMLDTQERVNLRELGALLGNLASIYRETGRMESAAPAYERSLNIHEQLWALSIQDPGTMEQYLNGYSNVWESTAEMLGRIDPKSTEDERRTRAALIMALVDGLETFLRAEQLRCRLPASMKESVSELVKTIARG